MARTGRPPRIAEHYDTLPATATHPARDRTVAEAIVDLMRLGNYLDVAAHTVGVSTSTVMLWMREGAKALDRLEAGAHRRDLTANKRRYADFLRAVRAAQADAETRDVQELARLANGGIPLTKTTERWTVAPDGGRTLVEQSIVTTESLPDARVIMWRLERRFGDRWMRRPLHEDADDGDEAEGDYGTDPEQEAIRDMRDAARRISEGTLALEAAGHGDIVDAEIVDERLPDGS